MFIKISDSGLSETDKVGAAFIRGWQAVDTENVGWIRQSAGRGKYGLPKYYVILPVPKPETIEELLKAYNYPDSIFSTIRVWSLDEAIEIANKRLPSLLKRRDKAKGDSDVKAI